MKKDYSWIVEKKLKGDGGEIPPQNIINILLKNRGISGVKNKKEFFNPTSPYNLSLKTLGIDNTSVNKAIKRILNAKKLGQKIIIYGDYDTDGICATAILWECLYYLGFDVTPHIPERFSEGYGANAQSIEKLKKDSPDFKLLITVDNGIVAHEAVEKARELGIDVIVSDHHEPGEKYPNVHSIIHTTKIGGAAIAWIFAREIKKYLKADNSLFKLGDGLDLAALGTIADQLPLSNANRSFAKHGLVSLNQTKRPGLKQLFLEAGIETGKLDSYSVGFIIAPRLNAAGRLEHAIDSLRLICTKSINQARDLALHLGSVNRRRQNVVEEVLNDARKKASGVNWKGAIVLSGKNYHEGVIGLAASKLVEEFFRPAIVISEGKDVSKASARSIPGFDLIASVREFSDLLEGHGGHKMAAGFSINTKNLATFSNKYQKFTSILLTKELMVKSIKIDMKLNLNSINTKLVSSLDDFEPFGLGNPRPLFLTTDVAVLGSKVVGVKHIKFNVKKNGQVLEAIAFGFVETNPKSLKANMVDIVYTPQINIWNERETIQLRLKDLRIKK